MNKRAVVVGGGAAGASAAFRLQQSGVSVLMLERDDRVGGRTISEQVDGFILDTAAGLLPGTYTAFYDLMRDAGLDGLLEPMLAPTAILRDGARYYLDAKRVVGSLISTKLLNTAGKLGLVKVGLRSLRMSHALDFDDLSRAAAYDTESLAEYARRELPAELLGYFLNPVQKLMYTINAEQASVVDFFWSAKCLISDKAFCVRGGMGQVVPAIARHFEVRTRTEVLGVTETTGGVEVRLRDATGAESTIVADFCVIATPARDVPRIDRGLTAESAQFLSGLRYSTLNYLHLRLRQRLDEQAVLFMIPDSVDPELCGLLLDQNKGSDRVPKGKGAVSVYLLDDWSQRATAWADDEIFRQALLKVERALPGVGALVEGYYIKRWDWAATVSYAGYYQELARFTRGLNIERRVQLAGDYFSMASVNSAVTSGAIAARRLLARYC